MAPQTNSSIHRTLVRTIHIKTADKEFCNDCQYLIQLYPTLKQCMQYNRALEETKDKPLRCNQCREEDITDIDEGGC